MEITYLSGKKVKIGDKVKFCTFHTWEEGIVKEIIIKESKKSIEFDLRGGGIFVETPKSGLVFWSCLDEDIILLKRKERIKS